MTDADEEAVGPVPLPEPRELTVGERAMVDFLLAGPLGSEELRAQARTARVKALCSCGCPSVFLDVDRTLPPVTFDPDDLPSVRNVGAVMITATQPKARGATEVTLHVCAGYIEELEIWAGGYGVRPRVDPAKLEHLDWRSVLNESE